MKTHAALQAIIAVAIVSVIALSGCSKSKTCGCYSGIGIRIVDTALYDATEGWKHMPVATNYERKTIEEGECSDFDYFHNTPDSLMNEYGFVTYGYMECKEK